MIVDSAFCIALIPYIFFGIAAHAVLDRFGCDEMLAALDSLAESRQQLLRWLAHEARVPLNSLHMGLELLNDSASPVRLALPKGHDDLETLSQCGSAAEALIAVLSDVLDLKCVRRGCGLRDGSKE